MSGPPKVKSMNLSDPEVRPVLGPAGNKSRSAELWKPIVKPKSEKTRRIQDVEVTKGKKSPVALQEPGMASDKIPSPVGLRKSFSSVATTLRQRQPNLSLNASCSSDASSDSSHSRASTGRISRRSGTPRTPSKTKQQLAVKSEKIETKEGNGDNVEVDSDAIEADSAVVKKKCGWVTPNTDPLYAAFHDEEWGLPVHDDMKLFELLSLSTALAELTWPVILSKRHIFREVFMDFDPIAVSKLSEKKIATPGSPASTLLSDLKLRSIIENGRHICKIVEEFGSFDRYIWGFVNHKPIVSNFRYPRQVPIKTSKAETISKDMVRRGLRGVGPTVVYSFMQVAGITNDHLITCFRHQDCINPGKNDDITSKNEAKLPGDALEAEIVRDIDNLSLSR
ncbi:uncharacterized protein LOC127263096 [Andrographis paniculata]|uniref:uncharacterized protein LOC127263096 n=1 Tax=Andrographis paniculata TaxID=175694 RepID=UPI0021E95604|nr:uncharacterized protein LOC127263096 [Andrographis paniculata]